MNDFNKEVYKVVANVPKGKVITYGEIAKIIGKPGYSRRVGAAMRDCPENLPWQRVVRSDGSIVGGNYSEIRRNRLIQEGVSFNPSGKVNMKVSSVFSNDSGE